jgi:hypothetical protein
MNRPDEPYIITVRRTSALGNYYGPEPDEAADEPELEVAQPAEVVDVVPELAPRRWSEIEAHERGKRVGR